MAEERDDLRGDIAKAYDELAGTSDAPPPASDAPNIAADGPPAAETDEQRAERARDEAGRFAKQPKESKARDTLSLKAKPPAPDASSPGAQPPPVVAAQPVAPTPADKIPAPQEWSGLAKVRWDKLPPAVQQEIVQREQQRAAATQDLLPVKELFDANREFLVNQAGSIPEAMRQMMQFARMSVDNPVQLAEHILRARGIDPRQAFAGQPQGAPQQTQAPDIQSYVAQLVQQAVQPFQAQAEQQQTQQLQTTIDTFGADPKHPFFNDVRVHMGQLISAGAAKSMDEAYEQATWANPAIRAHLLEEQRGATQAAAAASVQKAKQATRATVTGSPLNGAMPTGGPKGNVRDVVRELYDELAGG